MNSVFGYYHLYLFRTLFFQMGEVRKIKSWQSGHRLLRLRSVNIRFI